MANSVRLQALAVWWVSCFSCMIVLECDESPNVYKKALLN